MQLKRGLVLATAALAAVTLTAACSSSSKSNAGASSSAGGGGSSSSGATLTGDCAPYSAYAGHSGKTVTMFGSILSPESDSLNKSWAKSQSCTGITIQYTGSNSFDSDLPVKVNGGNAPNLAIIPQPGLLASMVASGDVKKPPAQ